MTVQSPSSLSAASRRVRVLGTVVTIVLGVGISGQARINGELGQRINDGLIAALVSFLGGLVLLLVLGTTRPGVRRRLGRIAAALRERRLRPSHLFGGVFGAFMVTSQGLTVALIGVAVFTVAVVAGQAVSSLLVDRAGIGPGGPQPITGQRVVGATLAVGAVLLAVSDRLGAPTQLWPALLPALAGVGIAWQQAVNGRVGVAARDAEPPLAGMLPAALVNFTAGAVTLLLVVAVDVAVRGWPDRLPAQPWLYLGGLLGVLFIGAAAAIVPITGVLLLGLGTVAGQLVGALLLDLLVPTGGDQLTGSALLGTALALLAVSVIFLPGRRREGR